MLASWGALTAVSSVATAQSEQPQDVAGDAPASAPLDIAEEDTVLEIATDDPGAPAERAYGDDGRSYRPYADYTRHEQLGLRLAGGAAFTRDVETGWFGRLDLVMLSDYRSGRGGLYLTLGAEAWGAQDALGASVPYTVNLGLGSGVLMASFGLGFDMFLVDSVADDTGVGFFAPGLAANVGFDFNGFRILADARGKYRWQFGAEDRTQALVGLSLEIPVD